MSRHPRTFVQRTLRSLCFAFFFLRIRTDGADSVFGAGYPRVAALKLRQRAELAEKCRRWAAIHREGPNIPWKARPSNLDLDSELLDFDSARSISLNLGPTHTTSRHTASDLRGLRPLRPPTSTASDPRGLPPRSTSSSNLTMVLRLS